MDGRYGGRGGGPGNIGAYREFPCLGLMSVGNSAREKLVCLCYAPSPIWRQHYLKRGITLMSNVGVGESFLVVCFAMAFWHLHLFLGASHFCRFWRCC